MKHVFFPLLLLICSWTNGQSIPANPGVPRNEYDLDYVHATNSGEEPATYFLLINKTTKERTTIHLPAKGYAGKPEFITDYIIQIPAVSSVSKWNDAPEYYFLYAVNTDSSYFLYNSKNNTYIFSSARAYPPVLIRADAQLYTCTGKALCPKGYWTNYYSKSYKIQCNDIKEGAGFLFFNKNWDLLQLKMPGATKIQDMDNMLAYFWGDTLNLFDIAANKMYGKYPTIPLWIRDNFYKAGFEPAIDKIFDTSKLIPLVVGPDQWTYVNAQGQMAFKPVQADLAFPFMFPNNQALIHYRDKWGLINKQGIMTYPYQFDSLVFGKGYATMKLGRNDTMFVVNANGEVVPEKMAGQKKVVQQPAVKYNNVCLVYIFEKETNYNDKAYILVTLGYRPENLNHGQMLEWVNNNIKSEVFALRERGYVRSNNSFSNQYSADLIYEGEGCYTRESEYKQKSSWVTVFEKVFN